jgi:protease IV
VKQFLVTIAGVFVGLFLFLVIFPIAPIATAANSAKQSAAVQIARDTVLQLDLREPMPDQRPRGLLFGGPANATVETVRKLELAETDDRVKGLFIRAPDQGFGVGGSDELRAAIAAFRKSGKFVITHSQGFTGTGLGGYYAVAGSDEVWLQDGTGFFPSGVRMEQMFARGLFDKIKASPDFIAYYEYKNAPSLYTETGFTAAHREAETGLVNSLYETMIAGIAADIGKTPAETDTLIKAGPYIGDAAVKAGFIDKLGMPEDAMKAAKDRAGKDAELLDLALYNPDPPNGPVIALVGGEGAILDGAPQGGSPFGGDSNIYGDDLAAEIDAATEDKDVKAIVFRISSPGGSPAASDQVWAAVERAKAAGKPVVVSMGEYAASGGYYVSAGANEIVTNPTTITGSIGVFMGKFVVDGTFKEVGVNQDAIQAGGEFAGVFSGAAPFTNSQRTALIAYLDRTYADFTGKVATGRKMPIEQVRALAKGRVWTGAQAKANGLANHVGGLRFAIDRAKALAGIEPTERVALRLFPGQLSTLEQVQQFFGASASAARAAVVIGTVLGDERMQSLLDAAMQTREEPGVQAKMEPVRID